MSNAQPMLHSAEELLPELYDQLKKLAEHHLQLERPWHTLQATALVHEAYLKLAGISDEAKWQNPRHFFLAAAEAMRHILVDHGRHKRRQKRGGGQVATPLTENLATQQSWDHVDVSDLLDKLAETNPKAAELVKLRVFIGMTMEEVSQVLSWSLSTTERRWSYAKAWLQQEIGGMG